ncbi:MAG: endonuclease/exonuclease/phosphatase family protein [Gammaproteobacteria bacterium]|nr:endonuclease/exonuclease/phosphatase family protein [Gammaproteobacteria bacterium]
MRLLTWNIHKGIGSLDRRYDLERVVAVIRHYDPDIVALQEVDHEVPRSRSERQAAVLAESLAMPHRVFAPNVFLKYGSYGNATLSRHAISRSRNIDLTLPGKKARGALYTEIRVQTGDRRRTLHVINVHLGLSGMERRWQVRTLLGADELTRLDPASRVIIVGDTNDWSGALARGRLRQSGFECVTGTGRRASLTFPSWQPIGALDRVFARGALGCEHHRRSRLALARFASDHLPVVVDIDLVAR